MIKKITKWLPDFITDRMKVRRVQVHISASEQKEIMIGFGRFDLKLLEVGRSLSDDCKVSTTEWIQSLREMGIQVEVINCDTSGCAGT